MVAKGTSRKSAILKTSSMRTELVIMLAVCLFAPGTLHAQTLNEIMFNPDGDENADEYIELVNTAATAIDLSGWRVTDGADTDSVVTLEQGLHALPGQYVLILDPDYFDDSSTTYDGRVPESALVVTIDNSTFGSRGLLNSGPETVSLIDRAGHCRFVVDIFHRQYSRLFRGESPLGGGRYAVELDEFPRTPWYAGCAEQRHSGGPRPGDSPDVVCATRAADR